MELIDMWVAGIKAKDLIEQIEENGGLDVDHIYRCYKSDCYYHRTFNVSFKTYAVKLIHNNFQCSMYIAKKVAEHFKIDEYEY